MTRADFLARCGNAFDAGLCSPERLRLLDKWLDFVLRFEGGQMAYVADFLESERERTNGFKPILASDDVGYSLIRLAAILTHHCQTCAVDREAWWTRGAFCPHEKHGCESVAVDHEVAP